MNYRILVQIFLRNQILASTLIEQMHYLVVKNYKALDDFVILTFQHITRSIINQIIHLSINYMRFKII